MVTGGFGESEVSFASDATDHRAAFALWRQEKEASNESLKLNARRLRDQQKVPLIVVVDDEPVVAVTLSEILLRTGKMAVWFTEPLQALEFFRGGPVDLLLSDITMPVMDGVGLAAQAHKVLPTCGILLFSAIAGESEVLKRVDTLGFRVQLEFKPLRVPCLLSTIERLLACGERT